MKKFPRVILGDCVFYYYNNYNNYYYYIMNKFLILILFIAFIYLAYSYRHDIMRGGFYRFPLKAYKNDTDQWKIDRYNLILHTIKGKDLRTLVLKTPKNIAWNSGNWVKGSVVSARAYDKNNLPVKSLVNNMDKVEGKWYNPSSLGLQFLDLNNYNDNDIKADKYYIPYATEDMGIKVNFHKINSLKLYESVKDKLSADFNSTIIKNSKKFLELFDGNKEPDVATLMDLSPGLFVDTNITNFNKPEHKIGINKTNIKSKDKFINEIKSSYRLVYDRYIDKDSIDKLLQYDPDIICFDTEDTKNTKFEISEELEDKYNLPRKFNIVSSRHIPIVLTSKLIPIDSSKGIESGQPTKFVRSPMSSVKLKDSIGISVYQIIFDKPVNLQNLNHPSIQSSQSSEVTNSIVDDQNDIISISFGDDNKDNPGKYFKYLTKEDYKDLKKDGYERVDISDDNYILYNSKKVSLELIRQENNIYVFDITMKNVFRR